VAAAGLVYATFDDFPGLPQISAIDCIRIPSGIESRLSTTMPLHFSVIAGPAAVGRRTVKSLEDAVASG
jgi:hypothetical protein